MKNSLIQKYRGLLALTVFIFHCGIVGTNFLWAGVETFFVLSAFFLAKSGMNSEKPLLEKGVKRVKRLYPAYLITICVCLIVALIFLEGIPFDFFAHAVFLQNLLWLITGYSSCMQPLTAHTWTMAIEVFVGLGVIVLYHFVKSRKKRVWTLIVLGLIAIAYRTILSVLLTNSYYISLNPVAHLDAIALGCLLCEALTVFDKEKLRTSALCVGGVGLLGIIGCFVLVALKNGVSIFKAYEMFDNSNNYLLHPFTTNVYLFISCVSVSILFFLIALQKEKEKRRWSALEWLGDSSYEIYLFHYPILVLVESLLIMKFSYNNTYIVALIAFVVTLLCVIAYKLILKKVTEFVKNRKERKNDTAI